MRVLESLGCSVLLTFLAYLLSACSFVPVVPLSPDSMTGHCLELYKALDQAVAETGTTVSSPEPVQHFPNLRVDRFLASYRDQVRDESELRVWMMHMAELALQVRAIEINSLPMDRRHNLRARYNASSDLQSMLGSCAEHIIDQDLVRADRVALLRETAVVPPDYYTPSQVAGLYPLSAVPVSIGISRWHEETHKLFALPLEQIPVIGKLQRYRSMIRGIATIPQIPEDSLHIPTPNSSQLAALFIAYAPVWEIDVAGNFDKPGTPVWQLNDTPTVDTTVPVVYHYVSYTHWQNRALLQLNYVIWFSERPLSGPFDIYGGALDGLIWRVTLDQNSEPLLFDTIHSCGCYHLFFPTKRLTMRAAALELPEPPLVVQTAPVIPLNKRLVIRVASGTHYVQRIYADIPTGEIYPLRDYNALYVIATDEGNRRSLFDRNGLVPGTERAERWLLWPMGIASPGAMRERGRHATAFVGRRHFDDASLLEDIFEITEPNTTKKYTD